MKGVIRPMSSKKKRFVWFIVIIAVTLLLVLNVDVRVKLNGSGAGIFVTLDKLPMLLADRVVISTDDGRWEITDITLIRQITRETSCATEAYVCCFEEGDRWIEVYCGNTMVRRMRCEENGKGIMVYDAGPLHWIIPFTGDAKPVGLVYLSEEAYGQLNNLVQEN